MLYIILNLLQNSGMSVNSFEKTVGLTQGTISNWKNGKNKPSLDAVNKIAEYFNVSVDYLLGRTSVPTVQQEKKNYSTYEQFLGTCERKKVTPEQVFNELEISLGILNDWKNGATPQDKRILHALANYFEENRVCGKANPFTEEAELQYELLQWFNEFSLSEKGKIIEKLKHLNILADSNEIAVIDATQAVQFSAKSAKKV